jgi:hypothetical protein
MEQMEEFNWDEVFGENGCWLTEAIEEYDYHRMHERVVEAVSWDGMFCEPSTSLPLLLHWGNVQQANDNFDRSLNNLRKHLATTADDAIDLDALCINSTLPWMLLLLGRKNEAAQLMLELKIDGEQRAATAALMTQHIGSMTDTTPLHDIPFATQDFEWQWRSLWLLATDTPVNGDEYIATLPDEETFARLGVCNFRSGVAFHCAHNCGMTGCVWHALACALHSIFTSLSIFSCLSGCLSICVLSDPMAF